MELKYEEIIVLNSGLAKLDGCDKVVNGEKVKVYYKFSGKTTLSIANNLKETLDKIKVYQDSRNNVIVALSNGGQEVPKDKIEEFLKTEREILESKTEINLTKIKYDDLRIGVEDSENQIPPNVVLMLNNILE